MYNLLSVTITIFSFLFYKRGRGRTNPIIISVKSTALTPGWMQALKLWTKRWHRCFNENNIIIIIIEWKLSLLTQLVLLLS